MALYYNNDGTVSEIVVNSIVNGITTSSLVGTSLLNFAHSSSLSIFDRARLAGSSSQEAYELAYPNNDNRTNKGTTYLSATTVQKTYSGNSYAVMNPNNPNRNNKGTNYHITGSIVLNPTNLRFASASWAEINYNSSLSASIATGSIVRIAIPTTQINRFFNSDIKTSNDIKGLTVLPYNGIRNNINEYNFLSQSISSGTTSYHAVLFASASRANMGSIVTNNLNLSLGSTQLKS